MALAVGQYLRRREPQGDEYDEVRIVAFAESSEAREPVIAPLSFGEPVAVHPPSLLHHYELVAPDDPSAEIAAELARLNDKPWETPVQEVTNG